jgi:hypothetical protein
MSRSNAENRLARTISSTLSIVTDNYVNSTKFNNKEEATETFNDLARTVVEQELRGAIIMCEKLTQNPTKQHTSELNSTTYIKTQLNQKTFILKLRAAPPIKLN